MNGEIKLPFRAGEVDEYLSEPDEGVIEVLKRYRGPYVVLGAGGKMGLHVCGMLKKAVGDREEVIAVSRFQSVHSGEEFERMGVRVISADLTKEEELERLPDAPVVFFLAGMKFGTSDKPELLRESNVEMPKKVAARYRNSTIVAFSTGCVYGFSNPESGGSKESDHTEAPGDYAQSCLGREQAFVSASKEWGTSVVLIRLNYSVEFRYGVLVDIAQKVLSGTPINVEMGYVNLIWQRDAVQQIIRSMDVADSPAVPLNITGPTVLKVRDLAGEIGKILGREPIIHGQEATTAWISDASYSHRLFGLPTTSPHEMCALVCAWLKSGGTTLGKPTGFEKRDGKF